MGDWADDCERRAEFEEDERLDFLSRVNEARANVIEAARAHKKREDTEQAGPYDTWTTDWDIYYAIEALDKAEAGDE